MRRSSTREKGQTEPLAALFAVAAMAAAISIYGGYVSDVLPGTSDRNVEEPTLERVWDDMQSSGVFDASGRFADAVDPTVLPKGYYVYVNVTRTEVGDAERQELFEYDPPSERPQTCHVVFGPDGTVQPGLRSDVEDPDVGFPDDAGHASRPIPVQDGAGDVVGARLNVVVWQQ